MKIAFEISDKYKKTEVHICCEKDSLKTDRFI